MNAQQILEVEKSIAVALRNVFDPEIPVNIYDLGLIYDISFEPTALATITMTLTAPNCPMADQLVNDVKTMVGSVQGVDQVEVVLTFEPAWDRSKMTDEALLELGLL